jgi:hypothetical protein
VLNGNFGGNINQYGYRMLSSGLFPGVCSLNANVSEHSVCSTFIGESVSIVSGFGGLVVSMLASGTFGGLVVSMLASGTQVRGFKTGRSRRIFLAEKILSMPSFRGEIKPPVRHVKEPYNDVEVAIVRLK